MTGQMVKRLQWNAHLYSLLTHHAQPKLLPKRGKLKYLRQSQEFKNDIKTVDILLKTEKMTEKVALDRMLITANKMCISASNLVNELLYRENATTKTLKHWSVVGNINTYHVGNCCTILELILEKLNVVKRAIQIENMEQKIKEAYDLFAQFTDEMAKKKTRIVTKAEINTMIILHILILNCLSMFGLKRCE